MQRLFSSSSRFDFGLVIKNLRRKSPTRNISIIMSSSSYLQLKALLAQIDIVLLEFPERFSFSSSEIKELKSALSSGSFSFSPLKLCLFQTKDTLNTKLPRGYNPPELPGYKFFLYMEPRDELVVMTLSFVFNDALHLSFSFSDNSFGCRLDRNLSSFNKRLVGWVERLLFFNLSSSFIQISRSLLLRKRKPLVDQPIFDLLSSFVHIPIIDKTGERTSFGTGLPFGNHLSEQLFSIWMSSIEPFLLAFLPARYEFDLFIPIFLDQSRNDDISPFFCLLKDFNLESDLIVLRPGDSKPVNFLGGYIFVTKEGPIEILPEDAS